MPSSRKQTITLVEYQAAGLPIDALSTRQAELLWQRHRQQVVVEPPSFKTQGEWQLTSQGWIGYLAVEHNLTIALQPKVPIANLFAMVDYAYKLGEIHFDDDLVQVASFRGYLDRLAFHFVTLVHRQQRIGLYRSYTEMTASLPYIRGQLDVASLWNSLPSGDIVCRYDDLTADVLENQIVVWVLHQLLSSNVCSAQVAALGRRVLADLRNEVSLRYCTPADCEQVVIHQLNQSYRPLIALARFFLSGYEPSHRLGKNIVPPFLINSALLFERFVAEWLRQHLPSRYRLHIQERRAVGSQEKLHFAIDLIIYERGTDNARFVMDTKYKVPASTPDTADIAQVVTYAEAVGASEAILIYPSLLPNPLDEQIGRIRVRSLAFDLADELDAAGRNFLQTLMQNDSEVQ